MSQGALFAFGCVISFIVLTGAFLFAMMSVREAADRDRGVSRYFDLTQSRTDGTMNRSCTDSTTEWSG